MPRPLRVFLCHASQDKPVVWKIHRYLKQHGIQPWLDQLELLPGQDWKVEIPKAIDASDVILVCLSKNSVNKEGYVQKEITFALDKALEKPEGTIFIIPVKLEECEIPQRLSRFQWVEYFRADGRKQILAGLNVRAKELGEDISPVFLEEVRKGKPATKQSGSESQPLDEVGHELSKSQKVKAQPTPVEKKTQERNRITDLRKVGFGGAVIAGLLLILVGGNYYFNNYKPSQTTPQTTILLETPTAKPRTPTPTKTITPVPPTITPTPGIGSIYTSKDVLMMYIPAGSFSMGSNIRDDESPIHAVYLDAYYIDKFEVTNASYEKCVEAGECKPPVPSNSNSRFAYYSNPEFDEYPVVYVSWEMAKTYCEWRGDRLPTEAEWEKAARGEDGRTFPWGDGYNCDRANIIFNDTYCNGDTSKVGIYLQGVSPYGTYDMAGNAWEWVSDWYDGEYYMKSPSFNPLGPETGSAKVFRGGSWSDRADAIMTTRRNYSDPTSIFNNVGFRCALSPTK